ncbi:MAG TPA: phage baseplate assembly protein V [Blastocatellia bacterium]|nr:phage baseplate assembly protein V [Blastocatellia bacterium]
MSEGFVQRMAKADDERQPEGFAIAPGVVTNNLDALGLGRVQVRVPLLPQFEPWCRMASAGGASGRGFVWVPQIGDEVLVAFGQHDQRDAYVIGGLWSTLDRPPLTSPADFIVKRVIKTGVTSAVGHEVEFDDALQSIKITTSTQQKITIDPKTIELTNTAGTLTIKMDNASQTVSISAALKIELKAAQISLQGAKIDLKGTTINIQSDGPCVVKGLPIKLN